MRTITAGLLLLLACCAVDGRDLDWDASIAQVQAVHTGDRSSEAAGLTELRHHHKHHKHHKHHHNDECEEGEWRKRALKLIDEAPAAGDLPLVDSRQDV